MYNKLCTKVWLGLDSLKNDERGVTALEYAILAGIIIVALVAAFTAADVGALFNKVGGTIKDAAE